VLSFDEGRSSGCAPQNRPAKVFGALRSYPPVPACAAPLLFGLRPDPVRWDVPGRLSEPVRVKRGWASVRFPDWAYWRQRLKDSSPWLLEGVRLIVWLITLSR
jgi:hypothetical protein